MVIESKGKPVHKIKETVISSGDKGLLKGLVSYYYGKPFNYSIVFEDDKVIQKGKLRLG